MTVHDRHSDGKTILIYAAWIGSYQTVQFLVNYGADLNATDNDGKDALFYARRSGYCNIEQLLLFSQFNATLDIVEEMLFKQRMPSLRYMRLDGRVPMEKRAGVAEAFNHDESVSVMLLTTRVGGLGLNLTGTSTDWFVSIYSNCQRHALSGSTVSHSRFRRCRYGDLHGKRFQPICGPAGKCEKESSARTICSRACVGH